MKRPLASLFLPLLGCLLLAPTLSVAASPSAGKPTPVFQYTDRVWGDLRCDGAVDAGDALPIVEWLALGPFSSSQGGDGCPDVILGMRVQGSETESRWGDVDCSNEMVLGGGVKVLDALAILSFAAGLPADAGNNCPEIGQSYPLAVIGK